MTTKARDAGKDFDTLSSRRQQLSGRNLVQQHHHVGSRRRRRTNSTPTTWPARHATPTRTSIHLAPPATDSPGGIWANTNTNTMWASDRGDDKIYSYNMPVIAPNTPAAGTPAVTAPNVFRVPAVLTADLSGITDTDGVNGHCHHRHLQVAAVRRQRNDAGHGQHRDGFHLHPERRGRGEDAEGGGQLHRQRRQQRGPADQRRDPGDHRGGDLCRAHPDRRGNVPRSGQEAGELKSYALGGHAYHGFNEGNGCYGSLDNATFTTAGSNNYEILGA